VAFLSQVDSPNDIFKYNTTVSFEIPAYTSYMSILPFHLTLYKTFAFDTVPLNKASIGSEDTYIPLPTCFSAQIMHAFLGCPSGATYSAYLNLLSFTLRIL
jgi:hypothetical protein